MNTIDRFKTLSHLACDALYEAKLCISNREDQNAYRHLLPDNECGLQIPLSVYTIFPFPFKNSAEIESLLQDLADSWSELFEWIGTLIKDHTLRDRAWQKQKEVHEQFTEVTLARQPKADNSNRLPDITIELDKLSALMVQISSLVEKDSQDNRPATIKDLKSSEKRTKEEIAKRTKGEPNEGCHHPDRTKDRHVQQVIEFLSKPGVIFSIHNACIHVDKGNVKRKCAVSWLYPWCHRHEEDIRTAVETLKSRRK